MAIRDASDQTLLMLGYRIGELLWTFSTIGETSFTRFRYWNLIPSSAERNTWISDSRTGNVKNLALRNHLWMPAVISNKNTEIFNTVLIQDIQDVPTFVV